MKSPLFALFAFFAALHAHAESKCQIQEAYVTACTGPYCTAFINNPYKPNLSLNEPDVLHSGEELFINGHKVTALFKRLPAGNYHGIRIKKDGTITIQSTTMKEPRLLGRVTSETNFNNGDHLDKIRYDFEPSADLEICTDHNLQIPRPGFGLAHSNTDFGLLPYPTLVRNDITSVSLSDQGSNTPFLLLRDEVKFARRDGEWVLQHRLVDNFGQRNIE